MTAFLRLLGQWWWALPALGVAAGCVVIAAGNIAAPELTPVEGTVLALACAALILVGLALRVKAPLVGGVLVAAGVGPSLLLVWAPVMIVLALLAVVGVVLDVVVLPAARGRVGAAATVGRAVAILAALAAAIAPLALGVVPGLIVTAAVAIAGVVATVVARRTKPIVTIAAP